jgi:hypothetical protein
MGAGLEFRALAEVDQPAWASMHKVRLAVESYLNAAFAQSSLAEFSIKLRYVPIIMPVGMRERYPSRSKVRKKENLCDCAPQLNYEIFVEGTFAEQIDEYLRGVALSAPHLAKLGASQPQIEEFKKILKDAADQIGRTDGVVH